MILQPPDAHNYVAIECLGLESITRSYRARKPRKKLAKYI